MPSMLVYQLKTANNKLDSEWVKNIDTSVLHMDFKYVLLHPNLDDVVITDTPADLKRKNTPTAS